MPQRELVFGALVSGLLAASLVVWLAIARRLLEGQPLVPYQPRLQVPWTVFDVVGLVVAWPALELIALRLAVTGEAPGPNRISPAALAAITAAHLAWVLVALVYLELRTAARARQFGFDLSQLVENARLGFLAFLAAAPVVYGIQFAVTQFWTPDEHPLAKLLTDQPSTIMLVLATVSAVIVAPLSEELLFRVILQGWLERAMRRRRMRGVFWSRWRRAVPILTSSLVFAAMHQGADRIALFVLALVLGFLYRQTHRIFPSLVMHACVNTLAVSSLWLGVGDRLP